MVLVGGEPGELRGGAGDFKKPVLANTEIKDPYLFAAVETLVLAQIISGVKSILLQNNKTLNSVRRPIIISLLYERFLGNLEAVGLANHLKNFYVLFPE